MWQHGSTINYYPNSELLGSEDTGLLIEIHLLEEGGSVICGSAVSSGESFCISYVDECNTTWHMRSILFRDDLPGVKGWARVVLAPSAPQLPSSAFYQPVRNGATASNIKNFKGLPLSSYTLERLGNIFKVLEAETHKTPMLLPEGIKILRGEGVNN